MSYDRNKNVWHRDIVRLGFTIEHGHDPIREAQCGVGLWIIATYILSRTKDLTYEIQWNQDNHTCELYAIGKDHDVLFRHPLNGVNEVERLIQLFNPPPPNHDTNLAC